MVEYLPFTSFDFYCLNYLEYEMVTCIGLATMIKLSVREIERKEEV